MVLTTTISSALSLVSFPASNKVLSRHVCYGFINGAVTNVRRHGSLCHSSRRYFAHSSNESLIEGNTVLERTYRWVKNTIIGLNMCPFAEKPLKKDLLSIKEFQGSDDKLLSSIILDEMIRLKDKPGISLIVAPDFYPDDFISYLDFIADLEDSVIFTEVIAISASSPILGFSLVESSLAYLV